jgi:hypothetical protein
MVRGGVSLAYRRATFFSLLAQREEGKRKSTPDGALAVHPGMRVRERVTGLILNNIGDSTSCTGEKLARIPCEPAYDLSFTRPPRQTGARGKRRASCAQKQQRRPKQNSNLKLHFSLALCSCF